MAVFQFARVRAVALLVVLGMGLAGQAVAGARIAPTPAAGPSATAIVVPPMNGCPACASSPAAVALSCPAGFCWTMVAIPATAAVVEPVVPAIVAALPDAMMPGLSLRPEPHPPRSPRSV
ncbi:MAG TPA: hypothetical protein VMU87_17360 [Stellaceae bacterium]|nr:hypothetical protein [Stellaceae bacterium]